jgi:hypothetical protein
VFVYVCVCVLQVGGEGGGGQEMCRSWACIHTILLLLPPPLPVLRERARGNRSVGGAQKHKPWSVVMFLCVRVCVRVRARA